MNQHQLLLCNSGSGQAFAALVAQGVDQLALSHESTGAEREYTSQLSTWRRARNRRMVNELRQSGAKYDDALAGGSFASFSLPRNQWLGGLRLARVERHATGGVHRLRGAPPANRVALGGDKGSPTARRAGRPNVVHAQATSAPPAIRKPRCLLAHSTPGGPLRRAIYPVPGEIHADAEHAYLTYDPDAGPSIVRHRTPRIKPCCARSLEILHLPRGPSCKPTSAS